MGADSRAYRQSVKMQFIDELREKLRTLAEDCEDPDLWESKEEVGREVLELVYEYFGEDWFKPKEKDGDDEEE